MKGFFPKKRKIACLVGGIFMFVGVLFSSDGSSMGVFFQNWLEKNPDYALWTLQVEISEMNYERAKIAASSEAERLRAELDSINRISNQQRSLQQIYIDGLNLLANTLIYDINLEIAQINYNEAVKSVAENQSLHSRKLISDTDMQMAQLQMEEAKQSWITAQWDYDRTVGALNRIIKLNPVSLSFAIPAPQNFSRTDEEYLALSYALKAAELNMKIAQNDLSILSFMASPFEQKEKELNFRDRELAYQSLLISTLEDHADRKKTLETHYLSVNIAKTRWEIEQKRYAETISRQERGLVSERDYHNARKNLRTAERTYYTSVRQYISSLIQYLIETGQKPEGVL